MLLCYSREILLERSRSKNENIDRYLARLFLLARDKYILFGRFTLNGTISFILVSFPPISSSSLVVIRSRFTAADTVFEIFFGGWLWRYSFKSTSKFLILFFTERFEAIEWDLHVSDLIQGTPEGPIMTPQCLFKSRFSKV